MGNGNVFIFGQTSNASGAAVGDARLDSIKYLATNTNGFNVVEPTYSTGKFTIASTMNYEMLSSLPFGMKIEVTGISDSIDLANASGSVSAANAKISKVSFTTDEAGDAVPTAALAATSCALSNQGAKAVIVAGTPCSGGLSGDTNSATVEVWGHYSCASLSNGAASVAIEGDFDGMSKIADSCVGGGGGGGGGIVPVTF
jgi:hypothetical protein